MARDINRKLESDVQSHIMKNLNTIVDSEWFKPTVTNKKGNQDIIGHIKGHYIAIEVKRDEVSKPRKLQEYRIHQTNKKGGFSFSTYDWNCTISELHRFAASKAFNIEFKGNIS